MSVKRVNSIFTFFMITIMMTSSLGIVPVAHAQDENPPNDSWFSVEEISQGDGASLTRTVIGSPPTPPTEFSVQRAAAALPEPNQQAGTGSITDVPAYDWSFGCSPTAASMIAGYYDRNNFPNMYTGPTDSGVMPLTNAVWGTWVDSGGDTRSQTPLSASRNGLDGRATKGHVDDYWREYGDATNDPFYGNWAEHAYGDSLGDYMKTNQWNNHNNSDGSTSFYTWTASPDPLTCNAMEGLDSGLGSMVSDEDGTYGIKLFYEARGYDVTSCYAQRTDNNQTGGFSFADYKAEIDTGYPVMLHVQGHTMAGVGYDDADNTVYLHDTWDYSTHTMTWGGSYAGMPLYAVSIVHPGPSPESSASLGAGKYDDIDAAWAYNGDWETTITIGAYDGTLHKSKIIGNYAEVTFDGTQFILNYTGNTNRGTMDVYIDGEKVGTIDQYASTKMFQTTWTSATYALGSHNLKLVHVSGDIIDIDAIEVLGPDITSPAAITDLAASSTWAASGTLRLSWTAPGDDGMTGTASSYQVRYSSTEIIDETAWDGATVVGLGIPTPQEAGSNESMFVGGLTPGDIYYFAVKAVDDASNPVGVSNSPSAAASTYAGLSVGKYDDRVAALQYSGIWKTKIASGSYEKTLHKSKIIGNYVEVAFDGTQFILSYTGYTNRGMMDVYIDGVKVDTIDQYASTKSKQATWTSATYALGSHNLRLVHISGAVVEVDAIEVLGPDTTSPAAITDLAASSTWAASGTLRLSWTAPGDDGTTGTASSYQVRYSPTEIIDETAWNGATIVSTGIPSPQIAGSSESMVVYGLTPGDTYYFAVKAVDDASNPGGVSNSPGAVASTYAGLSVGKYDDTVVELQYSGSWIPTITTGAYDDTLHKSKIIGNYVEVAFYGDQFILSYTGNTNRGVLDVYIDGVKVDTIDQYAGTKSKQATWTSATYAVSSHTLKLVHVSGEIVEVDAIEILGPLPELDYPDDGSTISNNNPSYQWEETSWATKYKLKVDEVGGSNVIETWYYIATNVDCVGGFCAVNPGIALGDGDYEWTVQPGTETSEGNWYAPFTFTVELVPESWTFLVYLNGDNSMESAGIDDFMEMGSIGSIIDELEIVVQFDRANGYDATYDDWQDTRRFLVSASMEPRAVSGTSIGEANMGDPQTLVEFVQWGMATKPADQYALIIWDHGNALNTVVGPIEAIAWDETSSGDFLTMAELSSALATITNNGENPIDLIGFDASLMGSIEVDNQLLSYAEIRVGSEEIQPDDGWPYDAILSDWDPTLFASAISEYIVDVYYDAYSNDEVQSAVDLGPVYGALNAAVNDFADALIQGSSVHLTTIESARGATQEFNNPDYVDLYDFAYQVEQAVNDTGIDTAATAVMTAVDNAVIREQHGAAWVGAHGVSIYFPELDEDYDDNYPGSEEWLVFTANNHWDEWLDNFYGTDPIPPLSVGKYDDTDADLQYTGTWETAINTGAYADTLHKSKTVGNYVEVTFDGTQFILSYTGYTNRGMMDVYIDGVKVDTIDQYASTKMFQTTWTSAAYTAGSHNLRLVHISGAVVEVDAIEVLGPDITSPAAITDLAASSTWAASGTLRLSWTAPGDDGTTGTALSYQVRYSPTEITDETAWNGATIVSTGIPSPQIAGSSESMVVYGLTPGDTYYFAVKAVDDASNPGGVSNSPGAAASTYAGLSVGKYDDTVVELQYSGSWIPTITTGAYDDTLHKSKIIGNYVEVVFDGTQFILSYTSYTNRGMMDVYIDGVKVDTIDQYAGTKSKQATWTSATYAVGSHTLKLVHVSGEVVEVDAVEVLSP